jgi:hypothetical protein
VGLGLGAVILLGIGAFLLLGGKKPPQDSSVADNRTKPNVSQPNKTETPAPVSSKTPETPPKTPENPAITYSQPSQHLAMRRAFWFWFECCDLLFA